MKITPAEMSELSDHIDEEKRKSYNEGIRVAIEMYGDLWVEFSKETSWLLMSDIMRVQKEIECKNNQ